MNNKFYEQYKSLFTEPNTLSDIKSSLPKYESSIPVLSNPNTLNKMNLNTKENELKKLFKQYAQNQVKFDINDRKSRQYESVASKQLSEVVLPKLKMYDQEIEKKLKRFKTDAEDSIFMGRNYSLVEGIHEKYNSNEIYINNNRSDFYKLPNMNKLDSPLHKLANKQQHTRFKHGYKFAVPSSNIFHNDYSDVERLNNKKNVYSYDQENPEVHSHSNNHLNPQSVYEQVPQVKRSRLKRKSPIFYMKNSEEDLQTEYQKSYSRKKLVSLKEQEHKDVFRFSRLIQKQKINVRNFHQLSAQKQKKLNPMIEKDLIKIDDRQDSTKKQNNYHLATQPSSPQQPNRYHHNLSLHSSRKQSRDKIRQKTQLYSKDQGMKFSQYDNQYAFINKRLDDIQRFNNYYSHNYINSYKRAIIDRMEGKRNLKERRIRLKYMLEKEQMGFEKEGEEI